MLGFAKHTLHTYALIFMGLVYTVRIIWFLRFKAGVERQAATGLPGTTPVKGILYSWANIAMPWAMESTRRKLFLYVQFVVFHLGVSAAIILSFIIPYAPGLLEGRGLVMAVQHRTAPRYGLQFHPESILTPLGDEVLARFLATIGSPGEKEAA